VIEQFWCKSKKLILDSHPFIDVFPCCNDISFWVILIEGPSGTPYVKGTWLGYVMFPESYPTEAPEVRFVTPIKHCNINQYGKVCHSIFTRNWTADTSMHTLLSCVYGLLLTPETDDPLDTGLAFLYYTHKPQYNQIVEQYVLKCASKSRQQLRQELGNDKELVEKIKSTFASFTDGWRVLQASENEEVINSPGIIDQVSSSIFGLFK